MNVAQLVKAGALFVPRIGTVPAAVAAGTRDGTGIDRATPGGRIYRSATLVLVTGAATGTPTSFTADAKLQHSSDNSTFADYTPPDASAAAAVAQVTAANTLSELDINLEGAKRYIRSREVVAFVGGSSPTLAVQTVIILGGPDKV